MLINKKDPIAGYPRLHTVYQIKTGDYFTPYQVFDTAEMVKRLESVGYDVEYYTNGSSAIYNTVKR